MLCHLINHSQIPLNEFSFLYFPLFIYEHLPQGHLIKFLFYFCDFILLFVIVPVCDLYLTECVTGNTRNPQKVPGKCI